MPESTPGKALTVIRLVVGGGTWFSPNLSGRLFGLDPDANPQASYVARLFAVRDAALGAGYAATDGDARRLWWRIGIACDASDLVAGALAVRNGTLPKPAGAIVIGAALLGLGLGTAALAADDT